MRLLFIVICVWLLNTVAYAEEGHLQNPGVVMLDLKQSKITKACNRKITKSVPEIKDKIPGEVARGLHPDDKPPEYFWFWKVKSFLERNAVNCSNGNTQACNTIVKWIDTAVEKDALKPDNFSKWPMTPTKRKSVSEFNFLYFIATEAANSYSIALQFKFINNPEKLIAKINRFESWMARRLDFYNMIYEEKASAKKHISSSQNHWVFLANANMALASLAGDSKRFHQALKQWDVTLDSQRDDGSLPEEAKRGSWALNYTIATLGGLLRMDRMAKMQGFGKLSKQLDRKKFNSALNFYIKSIHEHDHILIYAKENETGYSENWREQDHYDLVRNLKILELAAFVNNDYFTMMMLKRKPLDKRVCQTARNKQPRGWGDDFGICQKLSEQFTYPSILANIEYPLDIGPRATGDLCFYEYDINWAWSESEQKDLLN